MKSHQMLLFALLASCGVPAPTVVINEVTSVSGDQIELYNNQDKQADISGWFVTDQTPDEPGHRYTFLPDTMLPPKAFYVLTKGIDQDFSLGNDNAVRLNDADGLLIDLADYPPGFARVSFCRIPDGDGMFDQCFEPTIGRTNVVVESAP